jgi:hypothetical protein
MTQPSHGRPTPAGRSIIRSWVMPHPFSNIDNPAAWLHDAADESAQPVLVRNSPFNFSPSDTLQKTMKRLFWQILEEHRKTPPLF